MLMALARQVSAGVTGTLPPLKWWVFSSVCASGDIYFLSWSPVTGNRLGFRAMILKRAVGGPGWSVDNQIITSDVYNQVRFTEDNTVYALGSTTYDTDTVVVVLIGPFAVASMCSSRTRLASTRSSVCLSV